MFYKARSKETGNMWDVWMIHHDGTYYLYSICNSGTQFLVADNFSLASSQDGVHWTEIGPVLARDEGKVGMGTGSTWRNPVPGGKPSFQMNYSCNGPERQTIFFAQSDDLIHWTKCGPACEFVQDERWYERNGRWDCIWTIARPGGGLYGYWTATPKPETWGRFGFGGYVTCRMNVVNACISAPSRGPLRPTRPAKATLNFLSAASSSKLPSSG